MITYFDNIIFVKLFFLFTLFELFSFHKILSNGETQVYSYYVIFNMLIRVSPFQIGFKM